MSDDPDRTSNEIRDVQAIPAIRENPAMYVGAFPTGALLAARLVENLILLNAAPLRVLRSGAWHSIYAEKDWLAVENGTVSFDAFRRLIPLPSGGRFYDRAEVILTALADVVVTSGVDGETWIRGEPAQWRLPDGINLALPEGRGRFVVFHYSQPDFVEGSNTRG